MTALYGPSWNDALCPIPSTGPPFALVSAHAGMFGWWVALTLSSMLTAPYAAHAITVAYFLLRDPGRPVILDPGHRWQSVWQEQAGTAAPASAADESIDAEYQRRYDEYQQRWGGGGGS